MDLASGFDVRYEVKKDSKMTLCWGPEQLKGWRKIKFESENQKLSIVHIKFETPISHSRGGVE